MLSKNPIIDIKIVKNGRETELKTDRKTWSTLHVSQKNTWLSVMS